MALANGWHFEFGVAPQLPLLRLSLSIANVEVENSVEVSSQGKPVSALRD